MWPSAPFAPSFLDAPALAATIADIDLDALTFSRTSFNFVSGFNYSGAGVSNGIGYTFFGEASGALTGTQS